MVITHRLDLALRLIDTTTGIPVSGRGADIRVDGKLAARMEKPDGILVFQNIGKTAYTLSIRITGYEPCMLFIDASTLDPVMPLLEQHLIPGRGYSGGPTLTLEGTLPGIEQLSAVKIGISTCQIREFDPRKKLLTVFNPHKLELDRLHYALVDQDAGTFEPFTIVKRISEQTFKLDRVLETQFRSHFPISPVVLGMVEPDGQYRLRVRDDTQTACWLTRYVANGQIHFHSVDFRREHPTCLP